MKKRHNRPCIKLVNIILAYLCVFILPMSLENRIQQNTFTTLAEKAFINISYTHSYIYGLLNAALKNHNISIQQFNVLRILKGQHPKPVAVNEITKRMVDKMSNASRLVDKLDLKNLIERVPCSYDKRQVDISLTQEGSDLLTELSQLVGDIINAHSNLTIVEYEQLNMLLDKMRNE